ncbi:MAG TPA: hypothetical protein VMX75_10910 [Spirochaetia bacterium]|nr:hypothetical protein [Spirochaetia bacterium]
MAASIPTPPENPTDGNGNSTGTGMGNGIAAESLFDFLDNATTEGSSILPTIEQHRRVAADKGLSLEERLEAFQDISESETRLVG